MTSNQGKGEDRFLPTRVSLLDRLRNREDQESWTHFFETYWRLIYGFATQAGLSDHEAQEVVQETVISVAGTMPKFRYDPAVCSFKGWLRHLTQKRIVDQIRKRSREVLANDLQPEESLDGSAPEAELGASEPELAASWQSEWEENLRAAALDRLQRQVKAEHFQIFVLHVVQEKSLREVYQLVGANAAKVYVIKHRLSRLLREIGRHLEQNPI